MIWKVNEGNTTSRGTSAEASPVFSMQKRLNNVMTAHYSVMTLLWAAKNPRKREVARVSVAQHNDSL